MAWVGADAVKRGTGSTVDQCVIYVLDRASLFDVLRGRARLSTTFPVDATLRKIDNDGELLLLVHSESFDAVGFSEGAPIRQLETEPIV
jgi:hypothetical protein